MSNSCVGIFSQQFISQTRLLLRVGLFEFSVNYVLLISSWKIPSFKYKNVYIVIDFTVFRSMVSVIYEYYY